MTSTWGALVLASACAWAQDAPVIPRLDHVHAQLDLARDCRGAMIGLVGEARGRARAVAVSAYRAVGRYFPASGASVAQASFRAAELLRAGGEAGAAEAAFRRVAGQACAPVLAARARLEAGHLHRREERALEALAVYGILALDPRTPRRERSLGALWGARVLADAGHLAAAAAVWERVLRRATDPLLRVRASDDWGVSLADAGDFEAAAGVLHLCRLAVAERAAELTELGARVRRALEGMRLVGRLARGVRERHAASTPLLIGRVRIHR